MMFVVKRPFKSMGKFYGVGFIIEDPTTIKRFKSKVNEGKIIVVTKDNLQSVAAYIKARSGVDILPEFTETKPTETKLDQEPKPTETKLDQEPKRVAKAKIVIKK